MKPNLSEHPLLSELLQKLSLLLEANDRVRRGDARAGDGGHADARPARVAADEQPRDGCLRAREVSLEKEKMR